MRLVPDSIQRLIEQFDALPGIGSKNAARLAYHVLGDKRRAQEFARDMAAASDAARFCKRCATITDQELCGLCLDPHRDASTLCVVAHIQDIPPMERTGHFRGLYHVLHGTINPIEGMTPDQLTVKELLTRVKTNGIKEIILALDATMDGEATVLYLVKILKELPVKVSKLARGLPMGSNIEYADEVTLSEALDHREMI